jgi:hypothetical protein
MCIGGGGGGGGEGLTRMQALQPPYIPKIRAQQFHTGSMGKKLGLALQLVRNMVTYSRNSITVVHPFTKCHTPINLHFNPTYRFKHFNIQVPLFQAYIISTLMLQVEFIM